MPRGHTAAADHSDAQDKGRRWRKEERGKVYIYAAAWILTGWKDKAKRSARCTGEAAGAVYFVDTCNRVIIFELR